MKTLVETIAEEKNIHLVKRGNGAFLVSVLDAEKFIMACEQTDAAILGIEGFRQVNDRITPDMNFIADFSVLSGLSKLEHCQRSVAAARDFLAEARKHPEMLLDFSLSA